MSNNIAFSRLWYIFNLKQHYVTFITSPLKKRYKNQSNRQKWKSSLPYHAAAVHFQSVLAPVQSGRCGRRAYWPWWLVPERASPAAETILQGASSGLAQGRTLPRGGSEGQQQPSPAHHCPLLMHPGIVCLNTPPGDCETAAVCMQCPDSQRPIYSRPLQMQSL